MIKIVILKKCLNCDIILTTENLTQYSISINANICSNCKNKKHREWTTKNSEKVKLQRKNERLSLRKKVINAYGGKCNCCNESIWEFLTIDHVNNDGKIERANNINCEKLYRKIIKENYPPNYQILCYNCNCTKGFMGSCPHKRT